ncbi:MULTISPECIES: pimeloyl-ACP methyl ester esterase BioH [unclassified Neisseria]|uniref:pimeloyl-ACP methyl ester esterase BioH n=1 Tax=unclassified Neisseria TaxID=2623750 RepID=UPI002665017D|nr:MULTISPECIES: pimeloyl-ACP methyl ester esterase BioH [unclassified Neisseria]MDO1510696.1 pimeloyl-ACP methyl ester esterase BioH [Neisseria sp. MVDL19-042950]MDO1516986.1 pimeloyl-ACP methyl ester esterase BioH [Neisseria sp. MVDL18-041461]MDO1564348.1 pimeloyl-ACP methyl ester esterase BioH [Neisseria sp. MVDL20-010259]
MQHPAKKVYLIHGWAANRHIFDDLTPRLPAGWEIRTVNLPGHGDAPFNGEFDVAATADMIARQIDEPAYLLGWSLGGLISLYLAANYPEKVRSLCLTASFARFQAAPDYPEGLTNPALAKMIALFQQDYHKYMKQFLQLQFLYAKEQQPILEKVLPDIVKHGAPAAMQAALDAVANADARVFLPDIATPTLLIFGGKDSITPPRMGEYLHRHLPESELYIIPKAAHAPFLTQADEFAALLAEFFERH